MGFENGGEEMADDVLWIEPGKNRRKSNCDVKIAHYADRIGKKKMSIQFYNNSWLKITRSGYLNIGIDTKNMRIVMKDPYPNRGSYKLSDNGAGKRILIPFSDESFNGEYNLVPDDDIARAWHTERVR